MLNALKKLFGIKAAEKPVPAPYKVETPAPTKTTKKTTVKKVAVKKTSAKPRKPKSTKS
jgi:carbohydrate-binding DOMON domain-containing protein